MMNHARPLLLIACLAAAAMIPMYIGGVPVGNDQTQHYQFAWTVYQSLSSGEIYPSVAGDTNTGFGDVGLRFYPPLTYYVVAGLFACLRDWYLSSLILFTGVFFTGALGVYLWARDSLGSSEAALIASGLYTFAPYHLNLIYNNALMAEFSATAVLPFCFLFTARVCIDRRWSDVIGLAVAYALLILTHLPLTVIGSSAIAIYALLSLRRGRLGSTITRLAAGGALAIAMTSFYWYRMATELDWVWHSSSKYFESIWDYRANFLLVPGHFLISGDDVLGLWLADLMLITILAAVTPTVVFLLRRRLPVTRSLAAIGCVAGVAVIMSTPLSRFIWDWLTPLQRVQFPWRWLSIVVPFGSVFAAAGIWHASEVMKSNAAKMVSAGIGAVLLVLVLTDVIILKGPAYNSRSELNARVAATPASYGCECWWPIWATPAAFKQTSPVIADGRDVNVSSWTPTEKRFFVGPGEPVSATAALFYYPHWRATVNGRGAAVDHTEDGRLALELPAEASTVELTFIEPDGVRYASVVSLAAWTFVLGLAAVLLFNGRKRNLRHPA